MKICCIPLLVLGLLVAPRQLTAQSCPEPSPSCAPDFCNKTPAVPAPPALWDELKAVSILSDSSGLDDFDAGAFERTTSVFPVDGLLFVTLIKRFQIWDISNPEVPVLRESHSLNSLERDGLDTGSVDRHSFAALRSVRTPPNDSGIAVIAAEKGIGTAIFDTRAGSKSALLYQDHSGGSSGSEEKDAFQVEVLHNGNGRDYAFVAGDLQGAALRVYDLTRARTLSGPCVESIPAAPNSLCNGVHVGSLALGSNTIADGVSGVGDFVVVGRQKRSGLGGGKTGFAIYDVSNPANPVERLSAIESTTTGGVAMWRQLNPLGGHFYYVGVRIAGEGRIYDVSCVASGSCSLAAGDLKWSQAMNSAHTGRVTFSRSDGTPFLYFAANVEGCSVSDQGEWIFDVSEPSLPRDVTPQNIIFVRGDPTGYWSWYSAEGLQGYNLAIGRQGMFSGRYFFRAARSLLDSHRWVGSGGPQAPVIGAISASSRARGGGAVSVTQCESVEFMAEGVLGGTGGDYDWVLLDGGGSSTGVTEENGTELFVWNSSDSPILGPGTFRAELTLTNAVGSVTCPIECAGGSEAVLVSAPAPLPLSLSFTPSCSVSGLTVTCSANVSGASVFDWDFGDSTQTGPTSDATAQHTYANTTASYNVTVQVSNCIDISPRGSQAAEVEVSFATVTPTPLPTATPGPCGGASLGCVTPGPPPPPAATSTPRPPTQTPTPSGPTPTSSCSGVSLGCTTPTPSGPTPTPTVPVQSNCVESATALCLNQNRFRVEVAWHSGIATGDGQAVKITPDTGYFWFFNPDNVEIIVKVLDSCGSSFDSFWFFGGGLTDVFATIRVTDTETNEEKIYQNPLGTPFEPIQDTAAFAACDSGDTLVAGAPSLGGRAGGVFGTVRSALQSLLARLGGDDIGERINVPGPGGPTPPAPTPTPPSGPAPDPCPTGALCLQDGRFQVTTTWRTPEGGSGVGQPVTLTSETGYFSFFNSSNVELVVKVLDACATTFDSHWVFAAGLTNVEVDLTVLDTASGESRIYTNPQGVPFEAILDTAAFSTCSF